MSGKWRRVLRKLKLNMLLDKSVGFGLYEHANRNPSILTHLQDRLHDAQSRHLASWPFAKGFGVHIHGSCQIEYPRGLTLGNNVHIAEQTFIDARGSVTIGDNTHIARNVCINSSSPNLAGAALPFDNTPVDEAVTIGKNVSIGMNVTLYPGVTIGDGAVINMGTVITEDVAPLAIVSAQSPHVTGSRDATHYEKLDTSTCFAGRGGNVLPQNKKDAFFRTAEQLGENMFFVLGTGRSGSTAIAKALSKHNDVLCQHEPKLSLVSMSTHYAHGEVSKDEIRSYLRTLYCEQAVFPHLTYGESDQKLSNLVTLLHEVLPKAKFIWLLRNPVDTVNSTYSRGWFSEHDMFPQTKPDDDRHPPYKPLYSQYRVHADKMGVMDTEQWHNMSPFARNCWYWSYWNEQIETQLSDISPSQTMTVKLEELQRQVPAIFEFLGVQQQTDVSVAKANRASYSLSSQQDWSKDMHDEFETWCSPNARRWYAAKP